VKEVLRDLHRGFPSVNETVNGVVDQYYWLHSGDVDRWGQQCGTCAACQGSKIWYWGLMDQHNGRPPFQTIVGNRVKVCYWIPGRRPSGYTAKPGTGKFPNFKVACSTYDGVRAMSPPNFRL
jgi:hypothetical protein